MRRWCSVWRALLARLIAYGTKFSMRLILCTCRVQVEGLQTFRATASQAPCILMLWHNRLIPLSELLYRHAPGFIFNAVVSKSRDGEPVALLAQSYDAGRALRVPHNLRHRALSQMIDSLKARREVLLVTPDGPRGPKYQVKPGIIFAAREAAAHIVPFSWQADKVWRLNTWDQMLIPKPFSRIKVIFGQPLLFEKQEGRSLEAEAALLRDALLQLGD